VDDGVHVHAYGGVGQVSVLTGYPDLYRATTQGGLFRLEVCGEPGSPVILALALAGASIALPPYGTMLLDPGTTAILAHAGIPGSGIFSLSLQVPFGAGGLTPHFQAAIAGPSGLYLTNSVFPTIH
jgi:hypothetical protein